MVGGVSASDPGGADSASHEEMTGRSEVEGRYVPGGCNIGPEEIALRRGVGWAALVVTAAGLAVLVWAEAGVWWRLLLFIPATASASGFLQAHKRFCVRFSWLGVFNFGSLGQAERVVDPASRAKDRRQGLRIIAYAAGVGVLVVALSLLVG